MPRGPRLDAPGTLHHVMARGVDRHRLFRDDQDRGDFVQRLAALATAEAWTVYAWGTIWGTPGFGGRCKEVKVMLEFSHAAWSSP